MSHLTDVAVRLQVYLEGLKTGTYRDFNRVLRLIEAELDKELAKGEISELTREQLEKIIRRMSRNNDRSIREAVAGLLTHLKELAAYSAETEIAAIGSGATVAARAALPGTPLWPRVLAEPLTATGALLGPWIDRLTAQQVEATNGLLRRAHAEGWSNRQIGQVMRGTRANRYTDGLTAQLGRANATVIRTAMQHVNSVARKAVWEANDDIIKGYRWVSTLDSRTSSQCRGLDGKEFQVGQGPLPPIHPNCRSTTVAVLDPEFDFFKEGATRSAEGGSVSASITYYDWLKRQSKEFQDSVLGPTRGALLRDGGLSAEEFARLQLSKTFQPLTLDEMRRLNPLAFKKAGV